jgi:hypothetical protein
MEVENIKEVRLTEKLNDGLEYRAVIRGNKFNSLIIEKQYYYNTSLEKDVDIYKLRDFLNNIIEVIEEGNT